MIKILNFLLSGILLTSCNNNDEKSSPSFFRISMTPGPNESGSFKEFTISISGGNGETKILAQELINNLEVYQASTNQKLAIEPVINPEGNANVPVVNVSLNNLAEGWYNFRFLNLPLDKYDIEFDGALSPLLNKTKRELVYDVYIGNKNFIKYIYNDNNKYLHSLVVETTSGGGGYSCFSGVEMVVDNKNFTPTIINNRPGAKSITFYLSIPEWTSGQDFQLNFDFNVEGCELTDKLGSKKFSKQYKFSEAYNLGNVSYYWY